MKRYWLFAGADYCPYGGMKDFVCSFGSQEEAESHAAKLMDRKGEFSWWHILDIGLEVMASWHPTTDAENVDMFLGKKFQ